MTTNPVVRKALNSVSTNAQFKVGDIVEAVRPQVHKLGVKGTVTRVKPDTIIVKWHDDGFEAQYGIEGNFKNVTPKQVVAPEQKLREELMRSGYGRDRDSAIGWLTAHRRGLVAKYGRDIYEKVRSETARNSRTRNASSSPWGFFVGEMVVIKKDPKKEKRRIEKITASGDIKLEGAAPLYDASEIETANYAGPYRARTYKNAKDWEKVYQIKGMPVKLVWRGEPFNDLKATVEGGNRTHVPVARIIASNPVSQTEAEKLCAAKWRQIKATANAEDAQGHEHGSDGKFTSKGGGGKKDAADQHSRIDGLLAKAESGEDGYEDPKTKRMRERLEKMREKNEALRKDIEARKAGLAQKKADTEKMRAEVMKANVDKWKAGIPKTKNAVVAKALNAQLHDYEVPVVKRGVKSTVTIRRVADEETAKKLAADPLTGTEIDASRSVSVLNACAATNREFKPGDKVCIGGRAGRERGETVETIERVEGEGREKMLFFKGSKWGVPARMYAYANAEALNFSRGAQEQARKTMEHLMDAISGLGYTMQLIREKPEENDDVVKQLPKMQQIYQKIKDAYNELFRMR